jgi:hypothetical protein
MEGQAANKKATMEKRGTTEGWREGGRGGRREGGQAPTGSLSPKGVFCTR